MSRYGLQLGRKVNHQEQAKKEPEIAKEYLNAILDTIYRTEQQPIRLRDFLGKVHGYQSVAFQKQNEIYHQQHDINEKKILDVLDQQGWPRRKIIGARGNLTTCYILRHSGIEDRKRYIPMMRKVVEEKELAPRFLVRAEDRLATDRGALPIFRGQIKYYPETKSFNL